MRRLSIIERNRIVRDMVHGLERSYTCQYGAWNRDKLLDAIERKLRKMRKERK